MVHEFELLRSVAPRHEITLITTFWLIRPEALRAVQDLGVRVEVVPWPWERAYVRRNKLGKFVRLALGASPNFEIWSRRKRNEPLAEAVRRREEASPFDLVFCIQGEIAEVLDVARAPTALLLYDVYSRLADLVRGQISLRSIRYWLEKRNALPWEAAHYGRADAIACVSAHDAQIVSRMLGREVDTIVNPVPDEFFAEPAVERSHDIVTVIGSFGWEPNIDSVNWMCDEIWPLVRAAKPEARLHVAGRFASPELIRTVEDAGGEFFGDVDDIRPHYWEAAVVVANIRMGSGMRNKVLHAMACKAPLVATTAALEGIGADVKENLLVADDTAALAAAIVSTLNQSAAAAVRAEKAVAVAAQHSSAAAGIALEAWWRTAARETQLAARPTDLSEPPRASVVICTKERPELLRKSLAAINAAAGRVPGTEVVIVEQGEPYAREICAELDLSATVLHGRGTGVSRGRNEGIKASRGEVVIFTDDDCEVPPGWIRDHIDAMRDRQVVASFGPVVGLRYDEAYDPVSLPARHDRRSPPWVVGHSSNMAARRTVLTRLGGFDERMGPGTGTVPAGEDADLIVRLLRVGPVLTGVGEAIQHIEWRSSSDRLDNLMAYEHGAGAWIGKVLRQDPKAGLRFLKARVELQRGTLRHAKGTGDRSMTQGALAGALIRGLMAGVRLNAWKGDRPGGEPSRPA